MPLGRQFYARACRNGTRRGPWSGLGQGGAIEQAQRIPKRRGIVSSPLISVIVPIYNVRDHVADCIASLKAQTLTDFQAILVDDGSADDSAQVARQAMADDPRFSLISQDNQGLSGARNTGLDQARGAFIAFLDSDDRFAPQFLDQMWRALDQSGADWVACGIRFCFPDGTSTRHSAIHGQAARHSSGQVSRFALGDWNDAIVHFPSAWNKLYRATLIDGLRFPEGTWFEDHGFFYRICQRTDHILHLAAPLYLQTRGRVGQITGADDDRVFEQFDVLEDLRSLMQEDQPEGLLAFEKIASRLMFERSTALRDPARRAHYAQVCGEYLAFCAMSYRPDWDPHISRAWGLEIAGELPLSIVIPWSGRDPQALQASLEALARQGAPGREILIVCDGEKQAQQARNVALIWPNVQVLVQARRGAGAARNAGLAAAQGRYVCFVDAGDILAEMALHEWVDGALAAQADMVVSAFRQGVGDGDTHCGFVDEASVSRAKLLAAPFTFSGEEALLLDAQISAKLYRRAFLQEAGITFGTGALSGWQMALKSALLAQVALYSDWAGVDIPQTPLPRRSPGQLARALDRLASSLSPDLTAELPQGWWRRLYARALWRQLSQSRPRGRAGKAAFAAGAAWAALWRGRSRHRTPLDPGMGPRIEQILSLEALIRRRPQQPVAPLPILPHNSGDFSKTLPGSNMLSFAVQSGARFRYRAEFSTVPYANISFFDRAQTDILFHLSLRADEGRAVCNKRRREDWGREIGRKVELPATGVNVEILFAPPAITVKLDGQVVFRFGRASLRGRFPHSEQIAYVDFQGGITPGGVDIDDLKQDRKQRDGLYLNSRLELRAHLTDLPDPADLHMRIAGSDHRPPVIVAQTSDGADLRALLPGRVWADIAPDAPLQISLHHADGAEACAPLTLNRDALIARIEQTLDGMDLRNDALAAMQVLEHIRFAGGRDRLSAQAQAVLGQVQGFFGLDDYLLDATGAAPDLPPPPPAPLDPVAQAQAAFGQVMRDQPDTDPLALIAQLTGSMPREKRPYLYLALCEYFCDPARDFDAFHTQFTEAGHVGVIDPTPGDVWKNSALVPFLLLEGRYEALRDHLWPLTEPGEDWIVTPAMAWALRRVTEDTGLPDDIREAVLYAVLELIRQQAWIYWGRAHCVALTGSTVQLALRMERFADYTHPVIERVIRQAYGLSRQFWQMLDVALNGADCPPALAPARAAFQAIEQAARSGKADAGTEQALDLFTRYGAADALRLRRELLGPAGLSLAKDTPPDPTALTLAGLTPDEAILRHMAFPGAAPGGDALARLTARALPGRYAQVPQAAYYPVQHRVGRAIQALLAQAPHGPVTLEQSLIEDLRLLSGPRDQFLGLGLTLALIRGLLPHDGQQEPVATALTLLADLAETLDKDDLKPLSRAPAPRLALLALRNQPGAETVFVLVAEALPSLVQALPAAQSGAGPVGSALYDTIVTVFSCQPNLTTRIPPMRAGWLSLLEALDIPYVIVVGNGDGRIEGDVLHVDAPDDYEGLPQKTLATIRWVHDNTRFAHLLKIDDDCFLNVEEFFHSLSYRKFDYYGRVLTRQAGQTDRAWHNEKSTSARGRMELDKSPEPSTYTDGGSGYALSRTAMAAVIDAMHSPEGRYLIQVSFMEDKMLGDLLAMRGIRPEDEDYRISIRRRTWGKARPVSRWVNSFDASPAAPVKLVHLDAHDTQIPAMETLHTPVLTPKKIWPSYQDVQLVYQSNALELISPEDRLETARTAEVAVVACMRNEMFMLPQFLAHYRKLGVGSFLIVDNCSDDGTLEYLLEQPDVALFSVDTDYKLSRYGVAWQQAMMAAFRVGKWSLVADADELLVWQEDQSQTLPDLLKTDAFQGVDAARIFMLDMYPQGSLSDATFETDPFAEAGFVDHDPFLANWTGRGPFSNMPTWTSALRHRLIAGSRTDLFVAQKIALLKYQPWMRVSAGLHFLTDVQLSRRELIFAHFKYNADFRRKALAEVARGQHFNDAEEYRKYLALMSEGRDVIFEDGLSVPWAQAPFVRALLRE